MIRVVLCEFGQHCHWQIPWLLLSAKIHEIHQKAKDPFPQGSPSQSRDVDRDS